MIIGQTIGPYRVLAKIGEGGMGEVYQAADTVLKRAVAIKVLPASVADDDERLARFHREAEVLASLNHPNIAAIYGLERGEGQTALVMELVEGPTLADRIAQGAIPVDEALAIATQIADALEAAHEQGVVHRDLKPANIKLRPDGTVKVLDFGLAKAMDSSPRGAAYTDHIGRVTLQQPHLSQSPTFATPVLTQVGTIVGTASYMSPEQARGRLVDKRCDIWAFGCVLYEMLTGVRPFDGEDVAEVLGAVIHKDVAWSRLPATVSLTVRTVLQRCLEKDPKQRMRDIGDVRLALAGAFASPAQVTAPSSVATSPKRTAAVVAISAIVAAAVGAGAVWVIRAPVPPQLIAFTIDTPNVGDPASFSLSPDGQYLAFTATDKDSQKLWIRPLASSTAHPIAGTEQASNPFWSPDSRKIAFFAGDLLKEVDVGEGAPQIITRTSTTINRGGTWNDRDVIVFARALTGIFRVNAAGGEPVLVVPNDGGRDVNWPVFLPDGRHFIYLKYPATGAGFADLIWRDLESTDERVVRRVASKALYSASGHLIFRADNAAGALVAQRFDPGSGSISGNVVQVGADIWYSGLGRAAFTLSSSGILAYRGGKEGAAVSQLSWVDRKGMVLSTVGPAGDYRNLVIDRAGTHVAANSVIDDEDVWTFDVTRGTASRLTFDAAADSDPVFSPDGRSLTFYSARNPPGIYRKPSSGAGADEPLGQTGVQSWPRDWSFDGRFLLYMKVRDLWILPMDGDRKPFPYLATPAAEQDGRFSPDARWVAYTSDETGRLEVFVQDFPAKGAKFQVSTAGGGEARWRSDGRELFYLGADGQLMSVTVDNTSELKLGVPKPVFQTSLMKLPLPPQRRFAVSADGQRFLMPIPVEGDTIRPISLIVNWASTVNDR